MIQDTDVRHKIGVTDDLQRRLKRLAAEFGPQLRVRYTLEILRDDAFRVERYAHWLLRHQRLDGEWFNVGDAMAARVVRAAHTAVKRGEYVAPWCQDEPQKPKRRRQGKADGLRSLWERGQLTDDEFLSGLAYRKLLGKGRNAPLAGNVHIASAGVFTAPSYVNRPTFGNFADRALNYQQVEEKVVQAVGHIGLTALRRVAGLGEAVTTVGGKGSGRLALQKKLKAALVIVSETTPVT